jgi:plasmid stabilization system protein ParE
MGKPIVTPEAEADVDEAWDYLSRRNLKAADRLVDQFLAPARRHAQFPLMGESREDVSPGLRCFAVRPYIACDRVEGEDIRILRSSTEDATSGRSCVANSTSNKPLVWESKTGQGGAAPSSAKIGRPVRW